MPEKRRRTAVLSFDKKNEPVQRNHSYSLQAFEGAPGITIREFPFSHPRQLADIFPVSFACVVVRFAYANITLDIPTI